MSIEITGSFAFYKLEEQLRKMNLKHDIFSKVSCRWIFNDLKIDVMPTDENILGFKNSWYKQGIINSIKYTLPSGTEILIFNFPLLVASKMEAFNNRGNNDYLSKDMEDIIFLLTYSDKREEILKTDKFVLKYIISELKKYLSAPYFHESIGGQFLQDKKQKEKVNNVVGFINNIIVQGSILCG